MTTTRIALGLPVAAAVTAALFLLMRALVFVEPGELPKATDGLTFDIMPEVAIVDPVRPTPDQIDRLDPPPPLPVIDVQTAELPREDLSAIVGRIPEFGAPTIEARNVNFGISDRNAQPLVRIAPNYPPRLLERGIEGACSMQFDVTPDGVPTNIVATACTNSGFERDSIRAVERWRYSPKIENGVAVARRAVVTDINFRLSE